MPRSIPSSLLLVLLFAVASNSCGEEVYLDDAALKKDFETKLGDLFEGGETPGAEAIRRQLRKEPSALVALPTDKTAAGESPASTYLQAREATLVLGHLYRCDDCDLFHANLAGGVLLSPEGVAATNFHVLDFREALAFGAMTSDGRVFAIGEVLAASRKDDFAVVRLRNAEELPFVPLRTETEVGEEVFVVSHPDSHFYTLTKGYLARRYLTEKDRSPRLQITAEIARGSSGSGIFNAVGELVGVAASTNSIYHKGVGGKGGNLQMVIRSGVPASSILKRISTAPPSAQ